MTTINTTITPIIIGKNLNNIVLSYKQEEYEKYLSTLNKQKKIL